jgi:D-alanine-D-alanine ligase
MMSIDWHCPAPENTKLRAKIEAAAAAYRAFGCRDYARMDVRLWNGRPMVVDLNTNPDLHPESVFPMAAEALGLKYGAMAARLVDLAMPGLKRKRTRQKSRVKELVAAN